LKAAEGYEGLVELGLKALEAYRMAGVALNETYGFAEVFLGVYLEARRAGVEDPSTYAYEYLKERVSGEKIALLEGFYRYFKLYEAQMEPVEAARRALMDIAKLYKPELVPLLERFDFTNYSNPHAIASYVYTASRAGAFNISFGEFKALIENPKVGALELLKSRLSKQVDMCAGRALERVIEGFDARNAVVEECSSYIDRVARYPDVIPGEVRALLLSGKYGIVYVGFNESIPIDLSRGILEKLEERLKRVVSEAYYHGTLTLFADLGVNTEREVRRIDVVTAALVLGLLLVLLGSLAAPLVIIAATLASLTVSMGLLSVAAMYVDVYYLARVVMIPIVFGITVDYSVFYLFRVAEERSKGYEWGEAVYQAWRRAGRALVLGGVAVVLGFLAYTLTPQEALRGIGLALTIAAATSFLSSYTLLPAILALLGERWTFWPARSIRVVAARQGALLREIASASVRLSAIITIIVLLAVGFMALYLASKPPSANVHLGLPPGSRFLEASEVLYAEFPKHAFSKAYIVYRGEHGLEELLERLQSLELIEGNAIIARRDGYTVVELGLPVDPLDDKLFDMIPELRSIVESTIPAATLTGFVPLRIDAVNNILSTYFKLTLPLALALILLYLMAGMGSVVVPLRLVVTVLFSALLSLAAAALAFHYLTEAPAYGSYIRSPIYWVTPIIVLGLMVTLGMDYDIFLTSRIREEYERRGDQNEAILEAVEKTGVVITVCGLILAGAFASLLLTETPALRQVGFTVALSILVDTFIVRPVLVPAIMSLAGKYNWWPGKGLIRKWD